MSTNVLRAFRAPELRDLARMASSQGWSVEPTRGGHVRLTNPANGAAVTLSQSAYTTHNYLADARKLFRRAGLDLAPRPHRHKRQEDRPMTQPQEPQAPKVRPPIVVEGDAPIEHRPGGMRAGGKYAIVSREIVDVDGYRVAVSLRKDGTYIAHTRDLAYPKASNRRQWQDSTSRETLLSRIRTDLAASPPRLEDVDAGPVPVVEPQAPRPTSSRVEREYPLAAALDRLDMAMAPALEALEAAGKGDAAGLLRGELERTPIERELLALYRELARRA